MNIREKIQRLENRVIILDNTIVDLRKPAWGNKARLRDCLKEREEIFIKLRELAAQV